MHCGVVDFSPRPISNLEWVLDSKSENDYFKISLNSYSEHYKNLSSILYNNEKTTNLYSADFLVNEIIPDLLKIKNLIWINSNRFIKGWEGNFTKGRPLNIDHVVNNFDMIMKNHIEHIVDLKTWNDTK